VRCGRNQWQIHTASVASLGARIVTRAFVAVEALRAGSMEGCGSLDYGFLGDQNHHRQMVGNVGWTRLAREELQERGVALATLIVANRDTLGRSVGVQ